MRNYFTLILALLASQVAMAQYDPAGGEPGSLAVHKNSGRITSWATYATVQRGWMDASDTTLGKVSLGNPPEVLGPADRFVMSLGDGGQVTLRFDKPLVNFEKEDFAVFENGFPFMGAYFLELAYVEVSANGKDYFRFPAISLTDTVSQFDNGSVLDPTKLKNFAGKHQAEYGTAFDLDELKDTLGELIDSIRFIRVVDVVGSLNDSFGTRDSRGVKVNDPWPTPFNSAGFDLDAVAILGGVVSMESMNEQLLVYPNPAQRGEQIQLPFTVDNVQIFTTDGRLLRNVDGLQSEVNTSMLSTGIYILRLSKKESQWQSRLIVY